MEIRSGAEVAISVEYLGMSRQVGFFGLLLVELLILVLLRQYLWGWKFFLMLR